MRRSAAVLLLVEQLLWCGVRLKKTSEATEDLCEGTTAQQTQKTLETLPATHGATTTVGGRRCMCVFVCVCMRLLGQR